MILLVASTLARPPAGGCWTEPPAFDRGTSPLAFHHTPALVSDAMLGISYVGALALPITLDVQDSVAMGGVEWRSSASMAGAFVVGLAPPMIAKRSVCRERPYRLDPANTLDEGEDDYASFFSGHTASAGFASFGAVSTVYAARGHDPAALYIGYPLAAVWTGTMGALRVAAGKHYLSDVLLGGVSGAAAGILVPLAIDQTRAPSQAPPAAVIEVGGDW